MTEPKKPEYSLKNVMDTFGAICIIIVPNKNQIFGKKASEVSDELLVKLCGSFVICGDLFNKLLDQWFNSRSQGSDAIQKSQNLDEQIDIKLYNTCKLDFEQMKKTMARLNSIDTLLMGLEQIMPLYIRTYAKLCEEKGLSECLDMCNSFKVYFVERLRKTLELERETLENQVERCNLYYQAKLNTRTVTIAWAALGVSVLSILATIVLAIFK